MNKTPIVITDLRIPFWRLVAFFVKASIAFIPAAIIVSIILTALYVALAGLLFGALGRL